MTSSVGPARRSLLLRTSDVNCKCAKPIVFPSTYLKAISSLGASNSLASTSALTGIARPNPSTVYLHLGQRPNSSKTWRSLSVLLSFILVSFTILNSAFSLCKRSARMNTPSLLHRSGQMPHRKPLTTWDTPSFPIHACNGSIRESRSSFGPTSLPGASDTCSSSLGMKMPCSEHHRTIGTEKALLS
jgi:hypothetical protein